MLKLYLITILILGFLGGCSTIPSDPYSHQVASKPSNHYHALNAHYEAWKGAKHKYGGTDRTGIDCSAFVQLTYQEVFKQTVPRTTKLLSAHGSKVKQRNLSTGDLIFFKTGFKQRHVGIYMGQNRFLHVSEKRGVMISDLDNPYWKDKYWHSRRLL